ncbi:MAG: hypothetical protein QME32_02325 [Endomicrobiia bacterium]|nr:hypothetical protein [Endomicrobiia bacterium]
MKNRMFIIAVILMSLAASAGAKAKAAWSAAAKTDPSDAELKKFLKLKQIQRRYTEH